MKKPVVLAVALFVAACGGNDDDNNNDNTNNETTPAMAVTLDPSHVTIQPGGSATVTVNLVRTGSLVGANADLTASAAPTGLSYAFDNASTTGSTATLTITATADAATAASSTITATSGSTTASAALTVTIGAASTMTISGKVVTSNLVPVSFVEVDVWSHGATSPQIVTTNRDGTFTMTNVTPPYDVSFGPYGTARTLILGLTRPDPLLASLLLRDTLSTGTWVTVTPSGGSGYPEDSGTQTAFVADCGDASIKIEPGDAAIGDPYSVEGPFTASDTCDFAAVQVDLAASGLPVAYYFGSTSNVTTHIDDNSNTASIALDTTALGTHPITVHVETAEASAPFNIRVEWLFQDDIQPFLGQTAVLTSPFNATLDVPTSTNVPLVLIAETGAGDAGVAISRLLAPTTTSINITIPTAPTPVHPATGDDPFNAATMSFSVNGATGAGYWYVIVTPNGETLVETTATSLPASVLAARGITIPAATNGMVWTFVSLPGIASADDLASIKSTESHIRSTDGASIAIGPQTIFSTSP
jgi:hypothetical protein